MRTTLLRYLAAAAFCGLAGAPAEAQVDKTQREGIRNLARIDSTVACAGAITPAAIAAIKADGYGAIINLRLATEPGADIAVRTRAAKPARIRYSRIPVSAAAPDPAAVDQFLKTITSPGVEPAFIH